MSPLVRWSVLVLLLVAGCGGPLRPDPDPGTSITLQTDVSRHGVIHLPSSDASGLQGRRDPWLVGDDGAWYDLDLEPPFAILADPSSAGRPVTLTGDLYTPDPAPVGAAGQTLRVTDYQFDN